MDKQTKKLVMILGIVDAVVLLVFVFAFVSGAVRNYGGSASGTQQELAVSFDGGDVVGADSYVIKAPEGSAPVVENEISLDNDYVFPNSDSEYLSESDLTGLSAWELKVARNEIYARHGRKFSDSALAEHFESKSWYNPTYSPDEFDAMGESVFNKYELANIDLIREAEKN